MSGCAMSRKPAKSLTVFSRKAARVSTEKTDGIRESNRGPRRPEARAEEDGRCRHHPRPEEEPEVRAKEVVDDPARVGSQSHADAGNEKDAAVGRADGALAEVLPRHYRVERHHAAVADAEDHGQRVEGSRSAGEDVEKDGQRLQQEPCHESWLGADAVRNHARAHSARDGGEPGDAEC